MMLLISCSQKSLPYFREVLPAYDEHGMLKKEYVTLPLPYVKALLKDLDACYAQAQ